MLIQTHDGKRFDVPEENLEGFLKDYNKAIGFDPATLSPDPEVNPERGANWAGVARSAAQGLPVIGSYADEAEAYVRSLTGNKSYDEYLKNARESYEGAKKNIPEWAYPAEIGTGVIGEGILAALTSGASLHPAAQGAMGAIYGYGMGEGDVANRGITAGVMGGASAALPIAGKYAVKFGKPVVNKGLEYVGKKIANKEMPALMKALQKETPLGKAVVNTDKQPAMEKAIMQLNALQKTAQTEEQKTVVDNVIRAVNNGEAPDKILEDTGLILKRNDPFAREVSATLLEASTPVPQLNTVRTAINKAESFGEKTAVVNDLLKNTTKKESLYNAVSSDVRDVLNKTWDDQLREGILETARNHNLVGTDMKGLMNRLLVATSNGVDTAIKDTADDLVTTSIRSNIKKALANEIKLPAAFINELEDRITSEVLARRIANTLVGKGLESSASGLGSSLMKDAALGIAADAIIPGAGVVGALARNVIPGSGSTIAKLAGKASNYAVEKALDKTIKEGGEPALIKALSKNNPNMKNYANKTVKEIAKVGEETAEYKAIKERLEDKPIEKIVNALKKGYTATKEAVKKPAKQIVKEAIKATPKAAIPVSIREVVKEANEYEPFTGKQEREKRLNDMLLNNLRNVPNNTTIVLPDNDSGQSITQKHLQLLAALYPEFYNKVA